MKLEALLRETFRPSERFNPYTLYTGERGREELMKAYMEYAKAMGVYFQDLQRPRNITLNKNTKII